jgi:hypothetical protein
MGVSATATPVKNNNAHKQTWDERMTGWYTIFSETVFFKKNAVNLEDKKREDD